MPRITRGLVDNYIYHIVNRGNNKQQVFHDEQDYNMFINLIRKAKQQYFVKVFSYCLMPNHFHMVLMPLKAEDLSRWMQWLMTSHVRSYHKRYRTNGHIWQGRFKSFIIQKDEYLLVLLRYVEGNPVRVGLVNTAKAWAWSSHREMIDKKAHSLIDHVPIELPKNWAKYVDTPLTEKEFEKIHESLTRQCPCGTKEWQLAVSKELGLESTMRSRGRPKREVLAS